MSSSKPLNRNKQVFKARIAKNVPLTTSYGNRKPKTRQEKLELTQGKVLGMLSRLRGKPVRMFHKSKPDVGVIRDTYLDANYDWWVEMEFDASDPAEMDCITMIRKKMLANVSLRHNLYSNEPAEVSLVFKGARDGSIINPVEQNYDNNEKPYTLDVDGQYIDTSSDTAEYGSDTDQSTPSSSEQSNDDGWVNAACEDFDITEVTPSFNSNNMQKQQQQNGNSNSGERSAGLGMPEFTKNRARKEFDNRQSKSSGSESKPQQKQQQQQQKQQQQKQPRYDYSKLNLPQKSTNNTNNNNGKNQQRPANGKPLTDSNDAKVYKLLQDTQRQLKDMKAKMESLSLESRPSSSKRQRMSGPVSGSSASSSNSARKRNGNNSSSRDGPVAMNDDEDDSQESKEMPSSNRNGGGRRREQQENDMADDDEEEGGGEQQQQQQEYQDQDNGDDEQQQDNAMDESEPGMDGEGEAPSTEQLMVALDSLDNTNVLTKENKSALVDSLLYLQKQQQLLTDRIRQAEEENQKLSKRDVQREKITKQYERSIRKQRQQLFAAMGELMQKSGATDDRLDEFQEDVNSGTFDFAFEKGYGDNFVAAGWTGMDAILAKERAGSQEETSDDVERRKRIEMIKAMANESQSNGRLSKPPSAALRNNKKQSSSSSRNSGKESKRRGDTVTHDDHESGGFSSVDDMEEAMSDVEENLSGSRYNFGGKKKNNSKKSSSNKGKAAKKGVSFGDKKQKKQPKRVNDMSDSEGDENSDMDDGDVAASAGYGSDAPAQPSTAGRFDPYVLNLLRSKAAKESLNVAHFPGGNAVSLASPGAKLVDDGTVDKQTSSASLLNGSRGGGKRGRD